jgi:hypothetical protein
MFSISMNLHKKFSNLKVEKILSFRSFFYILKQHFRQKLIILSTFINHILFLNDLYKSYLTLSINNFENLFKKTKHNITRYVILLKQINTFKYKTVYETLIFSLMVC